MSRIKIKDLNVDLEKMKKKDPQILEKIRGGVMPFKPVMLTSGAPPRWRMTAENMDSDSSAGSDTMGCSTTSAGGCGAGPDTMGCTTKSDGGCGAGPDTMGCNTTTECTAFY